jgi:hypothetical protein
MSVTLDVKFFRAGSEPEEPAAIRAFIRQE